jgi:hypothetical protein
VLTVAGQGPQPGAYAPYRTKRVIPVLGGPDTLKRELQLESHLRGPVGVHALACPGVRGDWGAALPIVFRMGSAIVRA